MTRSKAASQDARGTPGASGAAGRQREANAREGSGGDDAFPPLSAIVAGTARGGSGASGPPSLNKNGVNKDNIGKTGRRAKEGRENGARAGAVSRTASKDKKQPGHATGAGKIRKNGTGAAGAQHGGNNNYAAAAAASCRREGSGASSGNAPACVVRMRGLPYQSTEADIAEFFRNLKIERTCICMNYQGRPSGESLVRFVSADVASEALKRNRRNIGHRYIELFNATDGDLDAALRQNAQHAPASDSSTSSSTANTDERADARGGHAHAGVRNDVDGKYQGVLRLRGVPYTASSKDINEFFDGFEIAPDSIVLTVSGDGRPTGEAYVEFVTEEQAMNAMSRHGERIGSRYIELFRGNRADLVSAHQKNQKALGSPSAYLVQYRRKTASSNERAQPVAAVKGAGGGNAEDVGKELQAAEASAAANGVANGETVDIESNNPPNRSLFHEVVEPGLATAQFQGLHAAHDPTTTYHHHYQHENAQAHRGAGTELAPQVPVGGKDAYGAAARTMKMEVEQRGQTMATMAAPSEQWTWGQGLMQLHPPMVQSHPLNNQDSVSHFGNYAWGHEYHQLGMSTSMGWGGVSTAGIGMGSLDGTVGLDRNHDGGLAVSEASVMAMHGTSFDFLNPTGGSGGGVGGDFGSRQQQQQQHESDFQPRAHL